MPLVPVADLRVTLLQIVGTEFVSNDSAVVAVRIDGEIVYRTLMGSELDAYLSKLFELTGLKPSSDCS